MNVVGVSTPDGSPVVPGVQGSVSVTFTLLNNNEPDLNNDVAEIDAATPGGGTNFNLTSYIVDVNLTATDVIGHQLTPVTERLTVGEVNWPLGVVQSAEFTMTFTVCTKTKCGVVSSFFFFLLVSSHKTCSAAAVPSFS